MTVKARCLVKYVQRASHIQRLIVKRKLKWCSRTEVCIQPSESWSWSMSMQSAPYT
jgi:hypothetical protein